MTPTLLTPSVVALPYYPCTASPLTSHPFNWLDEMSDSSEPTEIKVEPVTVSPFFGQCAQLAPQDSPFLLSPALSIAAPLPLPIALRKRSLSTSDRFRRHPYSTYSRRTRVLEYSADLDSMSSNPQNPYATWTPPSSRGQQSLSPPSYPTRRPSDNVQLDPSSIYPSEFGSVRPFPAFHVIIDLCLHRRNSRIASWVAEVVAQHVPKVAHSLRSRAPDRRA